jgi:hypothetical protein
MDAQAIPLKTGMGFVRPVRTFAQSEVGSRRSPSRLSSPAFSLIVTQFQSLSSFAAVVARLSALAQAVGQEGDPERAS